jgi:tetratricopeptide (TPR) repeat protein
VASPTLNARLRLELSLNLIDKGDLAQAQDELSRTLVKVESGPLAHQIALTLAQVCLDLKQEDQAVSVCQSVLQLEPAPLLSLEVSELLAKAYTNQQNYEKAAQVLIKQWK